MRPRLPFLLIALGTCTLLSVIAWFAVHERAEAPQPATAVAPDVVPNEPAAVRRAIRPSLKRPVASWRWPAESADEVELCSHHTAGGRCVGERSQRRLVVHEGPFGALAELQITRTWPGRAEQPKTCTVERQTPSSELRVRHDVGSVTVYGRTEGGLYTWQFNLDCEITAVGELPESVLHTWAGAFRPLPLVARLRASLEGVYFATHPQDDGSCAPVCALTVSEPTAARSSRHEVVDPIEVTHGWSEHHVWWAYWNETEWHLSVADRSTHQLLFSKMGQHREHANPIVGLGVAHGKVSIKIGSFLSMGRLPAYETSVYDIASGQLVASLTEDMP